MADFIQVTEIIDLMEEPFESERKRWISKYYITEMEDDSDHHQSFLIYNGKEIKVKESVPKILLAFKNP